MTSKISSSQRLKDVSPSGMRKLFEIANEMRKQGKEVLDFGLGDIDIPMPNEVKSGLIKAVNKGLTRYGSNPGDPILREKIAERYNSNFNAPDLTSENITVTCGALESLFDTLHAYFDPGDEIIIHEPSFKYFEYISRIAGAKPVLISTDPQKNFKLFADQVNEAITEKTKGILLNFPTNPTSAILSPKETKSISEVASDAKILLISDESYENIYFDGLKHNSFIEHGYPNTLLISSFSKSFCMTGLRVGYTIGASKEIVVPVNQIHQYNTAHANRPSQYAALAGMEHEESINKYVLDILTKRRDKIVDTWKKIPGLNFETPKATFYIYGNVSETGFGNSNEFCSFALEHGVILVPGTEFGSNITPGLTDYFRMSFGVAEGGLIERGADLLKESLEKN
jgi:aspartate aminotransferase